MLQLLSIGKFLRLPHRVIPNISSVNFRLKSDKCNKDGNKKSESKQSKCEEKKQAEGDKKEDLTVISGGSTKCSTQAPATTPKCPPRPCPPEPESEHADFWKKVTLMGALPLVVLLTAFVFSSHKEEERPEFKLWPHMYKRSKPFYFGDGLRTFYHNPHWNALPPDGYEDEIDVEGLGKPVETDKEREERQKDFGVVEKDWKKVASKREAEAKKAEAAAEKEAKKLQSAAEKEERKQQAAAEKEAKKQQAEAEKAEKQQRAEEEKERKRQEAEAKKSLKGESKYERMNYTMEQEQDDYITDE